MSTRRRQNASAAERERERGRKGGREVKLRNDKIEVKNNSYIFTLKVLGPVSLFTVFAMRYFLVACALPFYFISSISNRVPAVTSTLVRELTHRPQHAHAHTRTQPAAPPSLEITVRAHKHSGVQQPADRKLFSGPFPDESRSASSPGGREEAVRPIPQNKTVAAACERRMTNAAVLAYITRPRPDNNGRTHLAHAVVRLGQGGFLFTTQLPAG